MKYKSYRISIILSLFICFLGKMSSQTTSPFIQLDDASGFDTTTSLSSLDSAAQALIANLPPEIQDSFKVYDFGFYLLQNNFSGGLPEVFQQKIDEVANSSPYFLLFGKQSDISGIYTKFWLHIKLPSQGNYPCLTADATAYISILANNFIENFYTDLGHEPTAFHLAEIATMDLLGRKLFKLMNSPLQALSAPP